VNSISPCPIAGTDGMPKLAPPGQEEMAATAVPLRRPGTVEDIAHLTMFLASGSPRNCATTSTPANWSTGQLVNWSTVPQSQSVGQQRSTAVTCSSSTPTSTPPSKAPGAVRSRALGCPSPLLRRAARVADLPAAGHGATAHAPADRAR
jgi:hypothetical protein